MSRTTAVVLAAVLLAGCAARRPFDQGLAYFRQGQYTQARAAFYEALREIGRASGRERGEISGGGGSFKKKRGHTRCSRDWSSDVCSSDLPSTRASRTSARASTPRRAPPSTRRSA